MLSLRPLSSTSPLWRSYLLRESNHVELRKEIDDAIQRYQDEVNPHRVSDDDDDAGVPVVQDADFSEGLVTGTRVRRKAVRYEPAMFAALHWF